MAQIFDKIRRDFLGLSVAAFACGVSTPVLAAWPRPEARHARALSFHNLHTDERLQAVYWKDGAYDRAAWAGINHILRDHYSGESHVMDLRLIDLLHDLQTRLRNDRAIEIISAYRSPTANNRLPETGGVKNNAHMRGMAVDIRLDGTSLPDLHKTALQMDRGGVGYYPDSQFVHLDVVPVRRWG